MNRKTPIARICHGSKSGMTACKFFNELDQDWAKLSVESGGALVMAAVDSQDPCPDLGSMPNLCQHAGQVLN